MGLSRLAVPFGEGVGIPGQGLVRVAPLGRAGVRRLKGRAQVGPRHAQAVIRAVVDAHDDVEKRLVAALQGSFEVAPKQRGERFLGFPFRVLGGQGLDAVQGEEHLEVKWFFGPERAVVVKGGDTLGPGHEIRRALAGRFLHECDNGRLGRASVPGRQRVVWLGDGQLVQQNHKGETKRCQQYPIRFHAKIGELTKGISVPQKQKAWQNQTAKG